MPSQAKLSTGLGEAAITCALSQLGVTEVGGNNRGPEVEEYLRSVGLAAGFAWCAAFSYWCFRVGANRVQLVNPCPRTGGGLNLWRLADPVCHTATPARGCIYVLDHGKGQSHVGIVELVNADGTISEISGNTNEDGSRDGNAVWRHTGKDPSASHGGKLLGYLNMDSAIQYDAAA
jgi:CHAP domain-containing protein